MRPRIIKFILATLIISLYLMAGLDRISLAQEASKISQQAAETGAAFERALKNIETQRAQEKKALALKYKDKLEQAVNNWLSQRKALKNSQLNQIIDQTWEKLAGLFEFAMLHYDYYLRGFDYSILSKEIAETESLTSPIKAKVVIIEKIYAEKYHTPDISNVDPYFFTVTSVITLDMEYRQDNFEIIKTDTKITGIDNDCPDSIKSYRYNFL